MEPKFHTDWSKTSFIVQQKVHKKGQKMHFLKNLQEFFWNHFLNVLHIELVGLVFQNLLGYSFDLSSAMWARCLLARHISKCYNIGCQKSDIKTSESLQAYPIIKQQSAKNCRHCDALARFYRQILRKKNKNSRWRCDATFNALFADKAISALPSL